jgi:hypothetical protein
MKSILTTRKKIAIGLLGLWIMNIAGPSVCYALTSGPAQPEARAFQPAGVSDMVDLFTGDFKYNIPLLDVDGYPVNLNYESGSGMDDEASWVGLGWNLNVGAVNRQVRGLPDDMAGDTTEIDHYTKPNVTVGGKLTAKIEVKGNGSSLIKGGGSLSLGVFNNNYTGIGAEIGANAGISISAGSGSPFTSSLGLGITSNTAQGVEVSPYMNLNFTDNKNAKVTESAGLSASLGYNTRSGLKSMTLGSSFDVSKNQWVIQDKNDNGVDAQNASSSMGIGASGSAISYNTEPISPAIQIPYRSSYGSFSIDAGGVVEIVFIGGGASGYKSVREVAAQQQFNPAYGFLYAERGKNQKNAIMDFTREKDNPVIPELPNLALPVYTPDLFSFTSQTGSGQFRLYRGGSGAFFDNQVSDTNGSTSIGGDIGLGFIGHGGVTLFKQSTTNTTRKWVTNNNYLPKADFQDISYTDPGKQHAYFKVVGEKTLEDSSMVSRLHDIQPLEVSINGKTANASFTNNTLDSLVKTHRQVNQTQVSYLTAGEASKSALDITINNYPFYDISNFTPPLNHQPIPSDSIKRVDNNYHKKHHISEITVTDGSGKRMVYGTPVYNITQSEYSFAVGSGYSILPGTNNQVQLSLNNPGTPSVSINHTKGIDQYYHRQTQPAYAASYLLTAVLSPDYVDKTGNGITNDDLGTAIKFDYSKVSRPFQWRSPYKGGTLNKALLADPDDDKASIVYGEKELWYLSSIESKTKIAYFITQDRRDALGVTDFTGTSPDTLTHQKCLREIRLYSKADMTKPIKVVKFEYTYELCRHLPNNMDNPGGVNSSDTTKGGKLTLKRVYFEYANSPKGVNFPYLFSYTNSVKDTTVNYGDMLTDRWGIYKTAKENKLPLPNDQFPYTNQDIQGNDTTVKSREDQNAALWHLNNIKLPTGGVINVNYESDDYAYVQDKRAMAMQGVAALIDGSGNDLSPTSPTYLRDAKGLRVQVPNSSVSGDPTDWFKKTYLNGSDYLYSKFWVKVSTPYNSSGGLDTDFISSYSLVQSVSISGGYAKVILEDRSDGGVTANPIIFSAWQTMKNEYPRYAYPGFDSRTKDSDAASAVKTAVNAILTSINNLSELKENFYQKAYKKGFAATIGLNKCFVRLVKQDGHKLGGGVRVKKIKITDSWQAMAGNNSPSTASYGQAYDYTTVDNGLTISSGVAAYEPTVGCDENPLRQPVPYVQNIKGALDNFFDLEQPFGESFFPAPVVGYSKVTVTDLDKNGNPDPGSRTGYTVNEFYTAKDFPVQVTVLPLSQNENKPVNSLSFVGGTSIDELTMSQGYSITLNDMHGKMKATRTLNQSGAEIASTVYHYKTNSLGADQYTLNNAVDIVNPDGSISNNKVIGRDIDFFTDFREYETKNSGFSDDIGFDIVSLIFITFPLPHFPTPVNSEYKLFRSACAVKVNQYYGIVDKVVKTENGSSITTQNVAFDGLTGEPVVTKTQNEFNSNTYSVNMPAYWVYKGMGGAYQNSGLLLQGFTTDSLAQTPSQYNSYLKTGDEIVDVDTGNRYWIIEDKADSSTTLSKKLVNRIGSYTPNFAATGPDKMVKLVRSGYRNMLSSNTMSIVCLNNPIQSGHLQLTSSGDLTSLKVINASATQFNEHWTMDQHGQLPDSTAYITGIANKYEKTLPYAYRGSGGVIFIPTNVVDSGFSFRGALDRSGIWPTPATNPRFGQLVDIEKDFTLAPGLYYIGYSGDNNNFVYKIDGHELAERPPNFWCIDTLTLYGTSHHLSLKETNGSFTPPGYPPGYPGAIGLEIYTNRSGSPLVFSTDSFAYKHDTVSYAWRKQINPYNRGFFGNWRERGSMVFQQSRHYNPNTSTRGVDVKDAGYINNFSSYWYYGTRSSGKPGWVTDSTGNRNRWVTANTVTGYDEFGQQLENKDALGRFSAAKFDFNGELPSAVASNAMNREIYAGSFEDYFFAPGTVTGALGDVNFAETGSGTPLKNFVTNSLSHSGNYCVSLPIDGLTLVTNINNKVLRTDSLLSINTKGEYNLKPDTGLYPVGFQPVKGKKYIFDVWVKDGHDTDKTVNVLLSMNSTPVTLTCKALVEGWKLIEGTLDLSSLGSAKTLTLRFTPGTTGMFMDDLRIHPFNSQMKTYVYDDKTMRLMAEIDENGFATFYEYDDEGLLIRVKKETERGIMTIKESRSSYKKGL